MTKVELRKAYRAVIEDLTKRSDDAQKAKRPNRLYIQSVENARAICLREMRNV